ncbi:MAG: DUF4091 domain-containing protein [Ruminococcaceae bacterium]|nr:DUF4091 domain-containing protein [Oscillospiraceae bacterium]
MIQTKIFDSLTLIKPDSCPPSNETLNFSLFRNEPFSFQMAYKLYDSPDEQKTSEEVHFFIRIESDLNISTYHVGNVPIIHSFSKITPKTPHGMYPDILFPKKTNPELKKEIIHNGIGYRYIELGEKISLRAYNDSWNTVWFTVNEQSIPCRAGMHKIKIELFDIGYNKMSEAELTLEIIDALLPEQSLVYTNWFHNDCLADYYGLEMFSDEYFKVMADFLAPAVKNGMNMVLLPAFTPPLDTSIGEERMTVQLVDIEFDGQNYSFDFSLMKKYIEVCKSVGLKYFEHSHFFTQWGAAHAPKIIATVSGKKQKIFGWETDASGEEYVKFLRSYIPKVKELLKNEGLLETTLFHISDEPSEKHLDTYKKSLSNIEDLLSDCLVGDALSDYKYYESGLVKTPIARTHKVMDFVGKCDNLWVYYTGGECYNGLSNRLIELPRERNRMMGTQLYSFNAKGFLHWGYNFYYGRHCHGLYNPMVDPYCGFPNAGTTYSVYPDINRKPLQSIHQKIFAEGLIDMRALQLLEQLAGRKVCDELIENHLGIPDAYNTPDAPEKLIKFRLALNDKIKKYLKEE